MPTIQVSKGELLRAVAQLNATEYEEFICDVLAMRPDKAALAGLSEAELLDRIHRGLPNETRQRYRELSAEVREQTIRPEEHKELLGLVDQVERWESSRNGGIRR